MANNFYLGSASDLASNMGSMFGSGNAQGVQSPLRGGSVEGPSPIIPNSPPVTGSMQGAPSGSYDPLASQAIRPTSFGNFDPQYGQNLSTFVGNTFQRPQSNMPFQFNPFGNLQDANVQYPNSGAGNSPLPGLPQSLLAWAQQFNPTALATPSATTQAQPQIVGYDDQGNPIYG